jgi:hypothetical protein
LLHGPYAWLYPDNKVPCREQAREADRFVKEFPADLPLVIDFEWTRYAGEPANPNYSDLDKWTTEYLALGNRKPILYTAAGYTNQFGAFPAALKAKFSALWIANYGVINPTMPNGWGLGWDYWQASASGDAIRLAPNTTGKLETDIDYWRGDLASLYAFAGTQQEPPAEEPMPTYEAIAIGDNTRLRPNHSTEDDFIGNYPRGTKFHGDFVWVNPVDTTTQMQGDAWLQVVDVNGQAKAGWVAITHKGFSICTINPAVPPLEPEPTPAHVVEVLVDGVQVYRVELS